MALRKFLEGLRIIPKVSSTISEKGELEVIDGSSKLQYHNGTSASPIVTESHQATLSNKTLTSPVINTPTTDTVTGISGAQLLVQSATNQDLSLQAQGTGVTRVESLVIDANTVTGGASTLTIQSASNQQLSVQSQGTGALALSSNSGNINLSSTSGNISLTATSGSIQLNSSTALASKLALNAQTDSTSTGANATLVTPTKSYVELTNVSLVSVEGVPAGADGQVLILSNRTGNSVVIFNETGATASNRILTGTNGSISLENTSSLVLVYNSSASRWMIVGGVGGNLVVNLTAGETLSVGDAVYVSQGAIDGGRTAGRAYKLDATNSNRVEFIGFVLDAVASGASTRVQVAGGLVGLSGLSVGLPAYASVTTPGAFQTAAPTVGGQWVIQLGIATSSSSIVINGAGGATAVQLDVAAGSYLVRRSVTASTSLTNDDDVLLVNSTSGAVTVTLPTPTDGKLFYVKKTDASENLVTIAPSSVETIDGESGYSIFGQYDSVELVSDGTNWFVL